MSPQPDNQADAEDDRRDPARKANDGIVCQHYDADAEGYVKYRQQRYDLPRLLGIEKFHSCHLSSSPSSRTSPTADGFTLATRR